MVLTTELRVSGEPHSGSGPPQPLNKSKTEEINSCSFPHSFIGFPHHWMTSRQLLGQRSPPIGLLSKSRRNSRRFVGQKFRVSLPPEGPRPSTMPVGHLFAPRRPSGSQWLNVYGAHLSL